MRERIIIIIIIVTAITALMIFSVRTPQGPSSQKLSVVASFYPLAYFAEQVGGDTVEVRAIAPPGVESHDYEPTPGDLIAVQRSDIFLFNGGGFDPWAEKFANSLEKSGPSISLLNMSERLGNLGMARRNEEGRVDPHHWLDPLIATEEVRIIRDALIERNPSQRSLYEENARAYSQKLLELNREYEQGLNSCALRDIIISHEAFAYLGMRYAIGIIPIAGISPEEEPSPKRIGEIAVLAKQKGIRFIFFETAVNPKLAETIARESGAETLVLNPVETLTATELKSGEDYISIMKKNLNNLRKALSCI